jgi:branched-chain amino acid transport system substrate-binding protein
MKCLEQKLATLLKRFANSFNGARPKRTTMNISLKIVFLASVFSIFMLKPVSAENGITKNSILIGQSGEFSGQAGVKENTEGARLYFEYINKRGGINGRKVELKSYDDARDNKKTIENTVKLINEDKVFCLFGYRSAPSVEAVLSLLTENGVPMVAPFTGSQSIREPYNPMLFQLRASYRREAVKMMEQVTTLGIKKVAILYQDDAFGKDGLASFEKSMQERKLTPLAVAKYDRKDFNVNDAVKTIAKTTPEAILMACVQKACVDFVKQIKRLGLNPQIMALSNVNTEEFIKALGADGRGLVVTQVVPNPWNAGVPLVNEFQKMRNENFAVKAVPLSYSSFEGFIAAKLLVEALRRAGPNPTRKKFITAMESMRKYDLGGMSVSFSAGDRTGSDFVDISMIGSNGRYVQ